MALNPFFEHLRRYTDRQLVRPFALAGPVLVLIIALPMLRPLRHPALEQMSNDETLRLASIRALVEHRSLSLDRTALRTPGAIQTSSGIYSSQPPMMALLLSVPAWVITKLGISFADRQVFIAYLLTLIGVTLPVAAAAGLIYRMSRLFELRRPWRTALGFCVVACSGLLSYAVVLNAHAPAATLVIAAAACLIHVAAINRDDRRAGWFALAGGCAALAATIDPAAIVFLALFACVIPAMRFSAARRAVGVMLYIIGAIPVVSVHAAWNIPITGDIVPASLHSELRARPAPVAMISSDDSDDDVSQRSVWNTIDSHLWWIASAVAGEHGLLSHFPVLIFGILGISAVMHRHWPSSTKTLAAATGIGAVAIMLLYRIARADWTGAMFASRWFIIFTPILMFWTGAWLRRKHTPLMWGTAGLMLTFSLAIGLIGAADPTPRRAFDGYTAADALARLTKQPTASSSSAGDVSALAGRNP